jgi:hypothetical protein
LPGPARSKLSAAGQRQFSALRYRRCYKAAFAAAFLFFGTLWPTDNSVLSADVGFIPEMGGAFKVDGKNFFYVGREKKLVILNDSLQVVQTLPLLNETATIEFADLDNDGRDELIEISQSAVYLRSMALGVFGEPKSIIREHLALPLYVDNLEHSQLSVDFDHDGYRDFFLPAEGKFIVYHNDRGKAFRRLAILPYKPRGSFTNRLWRNSDLPSNSIRSTVIIPQPIFVDFNRDGILDAAARIDERVYYFLSAKDAKGVKQPFAATSMRIYPMLQQDIYVAYAEFADFDGDGNMDMVYSAVKGLGLNIRIEIQIFRGVDGIPDPAKVTNHSIKGGVFSPLIATLRGKKLLILPTVDTGIGFFANYILRSKISLTLLLLDPLDAEKNPLEKTSMTFDSKDSAIPGFTYGDYNNDGQTDFILGTEIDAITIYGGNGDFSKQEIGKIAAPAFGIFKAIQNTDGTASLFVFMTEKSKAEIKTRVYLARVRLKTS